MQYVYISLREKKVLLATKEDKENKENKDRKAWQEYVIHRFC